MDVLLGLAMVGILLTCLLVPGPGSSTAALPQVRGLRHVRQVVHPAPLCSFVLVLLRAHLHGCEPLLLTVSTMLLLMQGHWTITVEPATPSPSPTLQLLPDQPVQRGMQQDQLDPAGLAAPSLDVMDLVLPPPSPAMPFMTERDAAAGLCMHACWIRAPGPDHCLVVSPWEGFPVTLCMTRLYRRSWARGLRARASASTPTSSPAAPSARSRPPLHPQSWAG